MDADQARMARAGLKLSVREAAALAKMSPNTVVRVEAGLPVNNSTVVALRVALEAAGVVFDSNGVGPGVRMRKKRR